MTNNLPVSVSISEEDAKIRNYQLRIVLLAVLKRPELVGRLGDDVETPVLLVLVPVAAGDLGVGRRPRGGRPLAARAAAPPALEGDVARDVPVPPDLPLVLPLRYDPARNRLYKTTITLQAHTELVDSEHFKYPPTVVFRGYIRVNSPWVRHAQGTQLAIANSNGSTELLMFAKRWSDGSLGVLPLVTKTN